MRFTAQQLAFIASFKWDVKYSVALELAEFVYGFVALGDPLDSVLVIEAANMAGISLDWKAEDERKYFIEKCVYWASKPENTDFA